MLAPLLALALLTSHACGTVLSSDFYKERLREAEVYDFLYDELLAVAVADALESNEGLPPGVNVGADEVVASLRDALPPDWLQEQVEAAIDSAGPVFPERCRCLLPLRRPQRAGRRRGVRRLLPHGTRGPA